MKSLTSQFEGLADRAGFNASVRHIKTVLAVIDRVTSKENLADILDELVEAKSLQREDILPVVSMVLGEKFKYRAVEANLAGAEPDLAKAAEQLAAWNGVDLVMVYHHPELGVLAVNPKNIKAAARVDRLNRSELLVAWAGGFGKEGKPELLEAAAKAALELVSTGKAKIKPEFLKGDCVYRQAKEAAAPKAKAAPKAAPAAKAGGTKPAAKAKGGAAPAAAAPAPEPAPEPAPHKAAVEAAKALKPGARMTPRYSVPVTNELFHNGNVEAWKRIIDSYTAKYPDLMVLVYYDNERITNLNALFKWGKVKHGSSIQFAVAGDDIKDVAKLQRYLAQGASPQFEAFLKGPVNAVLQLF